MITEDGAEGVVHAQGDIAVWKGGASDPGGFFWHHVKELRLE